MKTEFTEVNETRKQLSFEVPPEVVDAEIARVAKGYAKKAKVPGFRQGKVPSDVVRQRYKEQILYDVANDLIPRLVGDELKAREFDPIATPDIRDVEIEEGRPLKFIAEFETLPPIDPGDYKGISLRKPPAVLEVGAVDRALEHLRERAARWHPVEDRAAGAGDTLLADLTRTPRARLIEIPGEPRPADDKDKKPETLENATIELGASANPPGFDDALTGVASGDTRKFPVTYPADYQIKELAGTTVDYEVTVKGIRRKELLPLDDDFAKEISELESLEALRERVRKDLQREAEHEADHKVRHDLLQELSGRLTAAPEALVDGEVDRRLEEFVRRLMDQGVDPSKAEIDWQDFRTRQREPALDTVRSTLVIDEIARRESIEATDDDLGKEIEKFAERSGHTPAAVRARLEKEGALDRIRTGVRREKTMAWLLDQATIVTG
jgi:trigger factor